jgi:hypothetical protein
MLSAINEEFEYPVYLATGRNSFKVEIWLQKHAAK